ncbi:MAG: aromatic-ring-hydroxylating dioxygenase subunit beta [Actinomycetota bacterium]
MSKPGTELATPTVEQAKELLFLEARLLDERRYEEWLELFTEDGLYWLPIHHDGGTADPRSAVSVIYDDSERRGERVFRTLHTPVLDQNPPSRTIHLVSNVEVDGEAEEGDAAVRCVQIIAEMRPGGPGQVGLGEPRMFAARCRYGMRLVDERWRISLKKLMLIDSDRPLYNLTFIL